MNKQELDQILEDYKRTRMGIAITGSATLTLVLFTLYGGAVDNWRLALITGLLACGCFITMGNIWLTLGGTSKLEQQRRVYRRALRLYDNSHPEVPESIREDTDRD